MMDLYFSHHTNTVHTYTDTITLHQHCYDTHADKFSSTRKKKRPEFERIGEKVEKWESGKVGKGNDEPLIMQNSPLHVLELGCGDGRFAGFLSDNNIFEKEYHYTGVDISAGLLEIAQKNYPDAKRVHQDMVGHIQEQENESIDIIVCIASFHHIPDRETREYFLQQVYRVLRYGGIMITIDRSRSYRMMRKYRKAILHSLGQSIISFGRHEYNTLTIPFHSNTKDISCERIYHFFTRREISHLCSLQGFIIDAMTYSHPDGSFSDSRSSASNICTMIRKDIFLNETSKTSSQEENI